MIPAPAHTDEQINKAVKAYRELQRRLPGLQVVARVMTNNPKIKLAITADIPRTDGKTIWLRPTMRMGEVVAHQRSLCQVRDKDLQLVCPACAAEEDIDATLMHELAHLCYESFDRLAEKDQIELLVKAMEVLDGKAGTRIEKLKKRLTSSKPMTYIEACNRISPFLGVINNALEDARVNRSMYQARTGTLVMFQAQANRVFSHGIDMPDGSIVKWHEQPLNAQAMIGVFCLGAGYKFEGKGWFATEVEEALGDPKLRRTVERIHTARSVKSIYRLGFPVLEELRRLGFCKTDDDPEDDPPPPPPEKIKIKLPDDAEIEPGDADDDSPFVVEMDSKPDDDDEKSPTDDPSESDSDSGSGAPDDDPEGEEGPDEANDTEGSPMAATGDEDGQDDGNDDEASDGTTGDDSDDEDDPDASGDGGDDEDDEDDDDDPTGGLDGDPFDDADEETDSRDGDGDGDEDGDSESFNVDKWEEAAGEHRRTTEEHVFDDELDGAEVTEDGTTLDEGDTWEPEYGDADDVDKMLKKFGGHENDGKETMSPGDRAEMNKAISQGDYFDEPSRLSGVRVHHFDPASPPVGFLGDDESRYYRRGSWETDHRKYVRESILTRTIAKARIVLAENDMGGKEPGHRRGKVNARDLWKVPTGENKVFYKPHAPKRMSYFVCIGIDMSGSTMSGALMTEKRMAYAQAEVCARLGIPFAIYGHTGGTGGGFHLEMYVIKEEHEPWNEATKKRLVALRSCSANLDGHSLEFYRKVCDKSNAKTKIIFYNTDGAMPCENYDEEVRVLKREIRVCRDREYILIGVGVGNDEPRRYGLETVRVDDQTDIPKIIAKLGEKIGVGK